MYPSKKVTIESNRLEWHEGNFMCEKIVHCCGCGGTISVAESRVAALPGGGHAFSCSPKCEQDYENYE